MAAGEHARWIAEHGGRHWSHTSRDRTRFIDVLPASALALGLWLEADRMKSLELSAQAAEREHRASRADRAAQRAHPLNPARDFSGRPGRLPGPHGAARAAPL